MNESTKVAGFCPMGCGETLFFESGRIQCVRRECKNQLAVTEILADPEHEHIVKIDARHYNIFHPLRERLGHELLDCELTAYMKSLVGPPKPVGVYHAIRSGSVGWKFESIPDPEASVGSEQ